MKRRHNPVVAFSARDPEIARAGQAITETAATFVHADGEGQGSAAFESKAKASATFARWMYAIGALLFLVLAGLARENDQRVACVAVFVLLFHGLAERAKH